MNESTELIDGFPIIWVAGQLVKDLKRMSGKVLTIRDLVERLAELKTIIRATLL